MTEKSTYGELEERIKHLERIQKALQEDRQQFRSIVQDLPVLVCSYIQNGEITFVNNAYCEYFNKPHDELIGSNFLLSIPEGDREKVMRNIMALTPGSPTQSHEHRVLSPGGKIRWQQWTNRAIFDDQGKAVLFQSIGQDITEQKQNKAEQIKSEKKYRNLSHMLRLMCDNVPDMIWAKDMKGKYFFANQAICNKLLHSSSTDEPIGKTDLFFAHREKTYGYEHTFGEICVDSDAAVKSTKKPGRFIEFGMVRGENLVLDVHKSPFYNESGEMIGTVGCGRDVTKEHEMQKVLQQSERRFRKIIEDVSGISIQGYDEQRNITFWNQASEDLYGYTKKEAIGKKLEDLIIPASMKEDVIRRHDLWVNKGVRIPSEELVLVDKFGNDVPVFCSHVMNETQDIKEMFCIDIDMTPIKNAEHERKQFERQLRQSQKMEAIGTLAGGIAHDFNNILSPILGHAEILLEDLSDNSDSKLSVNEIYSAASRAKDLVQQILTFSRQEPSDFHLIRVQHIVKEALRLLRASISAAVEIKQNIDPNCGVIKADPSQIHQIIMNLTTNASHSMAEKGGVINVRLEETEIDGHNRPNTDMLPGHYVCLTVQDNGKGIPQKIIKRIFDPFFTTKEKGMGTGMGLSVVHGIVTAMGGAVHVESELGKGTEFRVYFPKEKMSAEAHENETKVSIKGGKERILVVDDEKIVLDVIKIGLEKFGYRVKSRISSVEALEAFSATPDKYDLVISDVDMPQMKGDKLASEIIRIRPDTPVILTTGFSETVTEEIVAQLGIKGMLMKPIIIRKMAKMIRQVLDKT